MGPLPLPLPLPPPLPLHLIEAPIDPLAGTRRTWTSTPSTTSTLAHPRSGTASGALKHKQAGLPCLLQQASGCVGVPWHATSPCCGLHHVANSAWRSVPGSHSLITSPTQHRHSVYPCFSHPPTRSPKDNPKFDAMGEALYPDLHRNCHGFMRHKVPTGSSCESGSGGPQMGEGQRRRAGAACAAAAVHAGAVPALRRSASQLRPLSYAHSAGWHPNHACLPLSCRTS